MKIFKHYILPLIPIIGLFAIINDFHNILNNEKRPIIFISSAVIQAVSILFLFISPHYVF